MIKRLNRLWYLRAVALGGLFFNLLVFFYVSFSWLLFGYLSPHPPPSLRGRTLIDILAGYFTFAPVQLLFCVGGIWALVSEALVRCTKNVFAGLILSYLLLPLITFSILFAFTDMKKSGNMKGDLQGYWLLTNFYITLYWLMRSSLNWLFQFRVSKTSTSA